MFQILESDERLYDPLNNLSKMWIIHLDKRNATAVRKIY